MKEKRVKTFARTQGRKEVFSTNKSVQEKVKEYSWSQMREGDRTPTPLRDSLARRERRHLGCQILELKESKPGFLRDIDEEKKAENDQRLPG